MVKELPLHNDGYRYGRLAEGVLSRLSEVNREVFFRVFDFETLYMTRNEGQCHHRLRGSIHRARRVSRLCLGDDRVGAPHGAGRRTDL